MLGLDQGGGQHDRFGAVGLRPIILHRRAEHKIVGHLRDIGCEFAEPLDVAGHEQDLRAGRDVPDILAHRGENVAEQGRVGLVDGAVALPDVLGQRGIAIAISGDRISEHRGAAAAERIGRNGQASSIANRSPCGLSARGTLNWLQSTLNR
ncbi:hypothetical protein Q8A70_04670 [Rhodospirillaceae bacterium R-7]|uniref:Uncharacterized protein n=1 Tax=Dongia sedimenti TaxID=3064282 RepID=A0ABU0YI99_9PROT|nr:hypothetical protein [Rhodospirillaceae bacterium R-7]